MNRTFKYRIYPTAKQEEILDYWIYLCRRLYNTCLEQRQIAWETGKRRVHKFDQMRELPALKAEFPEYKGVGSQVLVEVIERLDDAFQRFFKGFGYPKYKGRKTYRSLTYKQYNCSWRFIGDKLNLSKCGNIKVAWSRPIEGRIKQVTIKHTNTGKWFAYFCCDNVPAKEYPKTDKAVGIDLGISALVTTSDGDKFANPKYLRGKRRQLHRTQRHMDKQRDGSKRREKTRRQLAKQHEHIANQRMDNHQKVTTELVRRYETIVHEDISPQFMIKNHKLAQAAQDAGWGQFLTFLQSKAAAAGRTVVAVNPSGTSQACSGCGVIVPKKLSERWHHCPECGCSLDRDHNAAINILRRAV